MKFKSLKFITAGVITMAACVFLSACNNEAENNSTSVPANGADTTAAAANTGTNSGTAVKKKTGKASASMTAETDATAKIEKDKMGYYNRTEVLPAYKGGQNALENYINNNIEYPQDAIDNSIEGTVSVQFVVDEEGKISNVKTIGNKVGYGLEEEAVKVVSNMPKWTAGQVKGKNVKTWRILPITYKLES
ncbi:MAG: energy transducer TonB [Bacteroidota bacterium]